MVAPSAAKFFHSTIKHSHDMIFFLITTFLFYWLYLYLFERKIKIYA